MGNRRTSVRDLCSSYTSSHPYPYPCRHCSDPCAPPVYAARDVCGRRPHETHGAGYANAHGARAGGTGRRPRWPFHFPKRRRHGYFPLTAHLQTEQGRTSSGELGVLSARDSNAALRYTVCVYIYIYIYIVVCTIGLFRASATLVPK